MDFDKGNFWMLDASQLLITSKISTLSSLSRAYDGLGSFGEESEVVSNLIFGQPKSIAAVQNSTILG